MRCYVYCTASSYNIKALLEELKKSYHSTLYRDALHVQIPSAEGSGDVFFFSYGAMVSWGLTANEERECLLLVKAFEMESLDEPEVDKFSFTYGDAAKVNKDEIVLPNKDPLTKLAFSHGFAQSVKLSTFELTIQKSFNATKHIPEDLAKRGRIPLSRHEIRRKMGELFIERSSINLRLDVLDTPEFFWEYPELEYLYIMIANYLEIESRVEVLNLRLDVGNELFKMLGDELNHQHSSRLEWTVIILIAIEIFVALAHNVFQLF